MLANALQVCVDSGVKKVLLPMTSAVDFGTVPADRISSFNLIFYSSAEDAVFKTLGVEKRYKPTLKRYNEQLILAAHLYILMKSNILHDTFVRYIRLFIF